MTYKAEGIIINKKDFREADRLFCVYTKEYGKLDILGQGTKKITSKLSGNLEILNKAVFTFAKGKQLDRVALVDPLSSNEDIKNNLEKLTCALYCLQIFDTAVKVGEPDDALYAHVNDFVSHLNDCEGNVFSPLAKLFIIKLAILLGYRPNVRQGKEFLDRLTNESISRIFQKKSWEQLDSISDKSLGVLLERPVPSSAFFEFLAGQKIKNKR